MKPGQTVLLADPDENSRKIFEEATRALGLGLVLAGDGQEALDIASAAPPDLIVIRCNIPVLDALSTSVLLKQEARTKDIPILVICGDVSTHEQESFRDAGCVGGLRTPFNVSEITEKLGEIMP